MCLDLMGYLKRIHVPYFVVNQVETRLKLGSFNGYLANAGPTSVPGSGGLFLFLIHPHNLEPSNTILYFFLLVNLVL